MERCCRKCGKPDDGTFVSGQGYICKSCKDAYMTAYREAHRAKAAAVSKQWREDNPEQYKAHKKAEKYRVRKHVNGNPARFLHMILSSRRRMIKRLSEKRISGNPKRFMNRWLATSVRMSRHRPKSKDARARVKANSPQRYFINITLDDLMYLWEAQGGKCAITSIPMRCIIGDPRSVSVDRIDSSLGYEVGNVQLLCRWVNLAKGTMPNAEIRVLLDEYHNIRLETAHART